MATKKSGPKSIKSGRQLSESTLVWLAIFFLLFAVLAIMAYYKQVEDAKQLVRFRELQEMQLKAQPTPSPTPAPKAKR